MLPIALGQGTGGQLAEKDEIFQAFERAFTAMEITPYASRDYVRPSREVEAEYNAIMLKHWRVLLSDIDRLPISRSGPNKTTTVSIITLTCEALPPEEYLDLLDTILDLTEAGKLPIGIANARISGDESKDHFIAVNYEHPRVKKIIERAKPLFSDDEEKLNGLHLISEGKLAENYELVREDNGKVYPELLPGIKRKRQYASLIEKYEMLTGKKVPPDPEFDPRPERRGGTDGSGTAEVSNPGTSWWLQTLIAGIAVIAAVFGIWRYRKAKAAV